jgi:SAM-dependent methyltransferase
VPFRRALPRADGALELLDLPVPASDLEASLADIARLNRYFGGARVTCRHLARLLGDEVGPVTVLDVGSGGADIPVRLARRARRRGRRLRVIALDRSRETLEVARRRARGYPEIFFVQADGLNLPVRTGAVDAAICSLTLHHFEPALAPRLLAQLAGASRRGFVVNDLVRSRVAYAFVWLATRFFARSPISRHDGPLSVRRSYTPDEVRALAREAGIVRVSVVRHRLALRLAVVGTSG